MTHAAAGPNTRESFGTEPKGSGTDTEQTETRLSEIDGPEAVEVDPEAEAAGDGATPKKPLGFYLSFFAINIEVFLIVDSLFTLYPVFDNQHLMKLHDEKRPRKCRVDILDICPPP